LRPIIPLHPRFTQIISVLDGDPSTFPKNQTLMMLTYADLLIAFLLYLRETRGICVLFSTLQPESLPIVQENLHHGARWEKKL